ncbi:temptin-like [Pecten maximus]|uniref:temptin-like n=1 Tax=Pecten maximus TaxID=6579 RepID=UPI0014582F2C|nr:temptin-like [Pecten maximus]
MMFREVLLCVLLGVSVAYPKYQQSIPNGQSVPNPCPGGTGNWKGVGHYNPYGGGDRNLFGLDFASSGHVWTHDLCMDDSDSDGVSNGVELGDPNCTWLPGQTPQGRATGHPGICEPMSDQKCHTVNLNAICV